MLTDYIKAAMAKATYEILEDDKTFYGSIPGLAGVWANEPTLEACREVLQSALEDWLLAGLYLRHPIPPVDGIDLNPDPQILEVA